MPVAEVGMLGARPTPFAGTEVAARDGYDRWAEIYDAEDNPLIALEERELPPWIGAVAGCDALDVGCGTGRRTAWLAVAGARVSGIDFSAGMLARARQRPALERVPLLEHDLTVTPWPVATASCDLVLSCLAIEHLPDLGAALAECARVTRAGGRIVLSAMHPAMMLLGIQARFTDPATGEVIRPRSATHQISDYVRAALTAGLRLEDLGEFTIDDELMRRSPRSAKYPGWPLLLLLRLRR